MAEGLRLAEFLAALSLATDLGMGQPLEQALRTCLIALALGDRLGLPPDDLSDVYYVALLRFLGCTADAHEFAEMVGGDDIAVRAAVAPVLGGSPSEFAASVMPKVGAGHNPLVRAGLVLGMMRTGKDRAREGIRAHCELSERLAIRLGLTPGVRAGLQAAFEQWNGEGLPNAWTGEQIPVPARIVFMARDVEILHRLGGLERAVDAARRRRDAAYDPAVADAFLNGASDVLTSLETATPWEAVLEQEPGSRRIVPETRLDAVLEAFADFVDLKSPFTAGHSRALAELAAAAAAPDDRSMLRRTALVHDLGRVSVPNGIWDKASRLTEGEWERVRLHPYYSERILGRLDALRPMATAAGMHHERLDGSGYHRGSGRADIPAAARVLAAADAYQAMTQPRAHRPALEPARAAHELEAMASDGRLDHDAVSSVLTAAGHAVKPARATWPAGLTDREVEVLRVICRGGTKKQVASMLSISPSTVDHHVRHIYDKAGVQSRAGATLFALEHDLLK
jgi:HD-GYP domain-containing protein (c-di-GMP phosphodiesterase class II)/DNA-binding CsgD family transcriptional regulator